MSAAAPDTAPGAAAFPWREALAIGLGRLALAPRDFWAMTPIEFASALGPLNGATDGPSRAGLDDLMARFPDETR